MNKLDKLKREQNTYVLRAGGFLALHEADEYYNDLNRKQIQAFKEIYGSAYLVKIGNASVYQEYTVQPIYNFSCDYCVSVIDKKLKELIKKWNEDHDTKVLIQIQNRVKQINGLSLIWF